MNALVVYFFFFLSFFFFYCASLNDIFLFFCSALSSGIYKGFKLNKYFIIIIHYDKAARLLTENVPSNILQTNMETIKMQNRHTHKKVIQRRVYVHKEKNQP